MIQKIRIFLTVFCILQIGSAQASQWFSNLFLDTPKIRVKLDYGIFQGQLEDNVAIFKGVPYAAPPIGSLRFRPPQPPLNLTGQINDATHFGPACLQGPKSEQPFAGWGFENSDEDCLSLNIWTPMKKSSKPLPVLLFLFGGAFFHGYSSFPMYDGKAMVKNSQDELIFISINYRLNIFGFMNSEELAFENATNLGIQDQEFALKWVKKYIHHFNGDPDQVTLFGESAGALSITLHMLAENGQQNYFKGAILDSGVAMPVLPTINHSQLIFNDLLKLTNCSLEAFSDRLDCLRNLDAKDIEIHMSTLFRVFILPAVDGKYITRQPHESLKLGKFSKIPLLLGSNTNEGTLFVSDRIGKPSDVRFYLPQNLTLITNDEVNMIDMMYNEEKYGSIFSSAAEVISDSSFQCPILEWAQGFAEMGLPVYKYRFNSQPSIALFKDSFQKLGVFHFSEIPSVFGFKLVTFSREEKKLSDIMQLAWINFAKYGTPNGDVSLKESMNWLTYKKDERYELVFETPVKNIHHETDIYRDMPCRFWNQITHRQIEDIETFN